MTIQDLTDKKIGILGYGQEGQAIFNYLEKHGLKAAVFDQAKDGDAYLDTISDYEVLFRSPGIWRNHPAILAAEGNGTIITSQTKWFFENSPAKIIGVTGTKGKGTTSSLIYQTLQAAVGSKGKKYLTGNIGKTQPLEFIDDLTADDWIVYELSSFQLQDLTISPHIGVCLMVTSDHLNHHSDLSEYHAAKSAISAFQTAEDFSIYNIDYPATKIIGEMGDGQKLPISAVAENPGGAKIQDETIEIFSRGEKISIDCSGRKLRGKHNLENIAASTLACIEAGVEVETIKQQINEFAGLEHRLQFIGTHNGISYYNDSISTVPETTIAAIKSFDQPIHLFLGGSDKGLKYDNLISELSSNSDKIASITLLGEIGAQLKDEIDSHHITVPTFGPYTDFDQAVTEANERAKAGEILLLSPASASFDMFSNYAERGRKFVEIVHHLTNS